MQRVYAVRTLWVREVVEAAIDEEDEEIVPVHVSEMIRRDSPPTVSVSSFERVDKRSSK
jgi:hypothetical protein